MIINVRQRRIQQLVSGGGEGLLQMVSAGRQIEL